MSKVDFIARLVFSCLLAASLAMTLPGCGKRDSGGKQSVKEALINSKAESAYNEVQQLRSENKLEEALNVAEKILSNPDYAAHRGRFFSEKIDILLSLNRVEEAQIAVLKAWKNAPENARQVFGVIYNHLQQGGKWDEVRAWCAQMLIPESSLPQELRNQVLEWQLGAAITLGDDEGAKKDIDNIVAAMEIVEATRVLSVALTKAVEGKQREQALPLLRYLKEDKFNAPQLRNMLVALTLRYHLASQEWDALPDAYHECVAQLPDDLLTEQCRNLFTTLQKHNKMAMLEDLSKHLAFGKSGKTNSINLAARIWVMCGINAKLTTLPERLDALLTADISPTLIGNLFDRYFYELADKPKTIEALCNTGNRIISTCSDTNVVNDIKVKVLDGAFITENYNLAVNMLEKGIPGKDDKWHSMSIPKVKAHRALAANEPREAVKHFREFMEAWVKSGQEEEFDPTTGVAHSREWILGRNAKRIAEILDAIPDKSAADEARSEARKYFKVALEKAEKDAEALKLLQKETEGFMQ